MSPLGDGRTRVGLLFGGRSVEHEVSVTSARSARVALQETDLELIPLAVTRDGEWLSPAVSGAVLSGNEPEVDPAAEHDDGERIAVRPGGGLLRVARDRTTRPLRVDVIFPLIHGWGGEDGRLQGALELSGVPYVGAGVLGSAAAMSKVVSKGLLAQAGIAVCPWLWFEHDEYATDRERLRQAVADLGYPVFVKPSNGGSSLGISKVAGPDGLDAAVRHAGSHDRTVVVERGLKAREIECAVLGNNPIEASGLGEIVPSAEFYDYDAKYVDGTSKLIIPAELPAETTAEVRRQAVAACRALDVRGFARVDFLVESETGAVYLNEVNTLPGFTPISMFPKLWEAAGLAYPALIERLVRLALEGRSTH